MSSFTGDNTTSNTANELQLAPEGTDGPDFGELKAAFERCVSDGQSFVDQCRQNFYTRYAMWPGQSADGKKHAREGPKTDPTPWEGASDLRVYLTDDAINNKVALYRMAFRRANLVAEPVAGNDMKRAKLVSYLMRYLIHTQMPELDREVELLANFILEKGVAATGQFWETRQEKTLASVSLEEMQAAMPNIDMTAVLMDDSMADVLTDMFERTYGCTPAKAKRMLKDLRKTGKTTVATLGRKISRPVLRAFDLSENLFIPSETTDIERASGIYRLEYHTPEALRAFVQSAGWDSKWVEKAIATCRGKQIALAQADTLNPVNRSFTYQKQTTSENLIGVIHAYQRLSDEDGVPGIYCTVFSPILPPDADQDGYAKFGLLEYAHGEYPFKLFRREFLSRKLHDSRGLPEPGKPFQDAIKAHMDSRIDAASIAIIPPLGFPMGRPPTKWGPGVRVGERRPGEYHFMDKPVADGLTESSQEKLDDFWKSYCGFLTEGGDPVFAQMKTQNEVDRFLASLAESFTQIFSLYQQYGDDKITFRVINMKDASALEFIKGDRNELFRFYFSFDTQSTNAELMEKKWAAIIQGVQMLDRNGNVNFSEAISAYFESVDPALAERILDPTEVGRERVIREEQEDLAKIFAGINVDIRLGTPPELGLETIKNYVAGAPDVQQRLQSDQAFRERLEARYKQFAQQATQQGPNRKIGQYGALMPGPTMQ